MQDETQTEFGGNMLQQRLKNERNQTFYETKPNILLKSYSVTVKIISDPESLGKPCRLI